MRIIPVRKDDSGQDVNSVHILQSVENGSLKNLQESIDAKDFSRFAATYRTTLESCYACHKAADKPYLRPQMPTTQPGRTLINFDPRADWPK